MPTLKTNKDPLNIFVIGDLGAGKATQSALLRKKFSLFEFDFGKEQDKLRRKDKKLDSILKRIIDKGGLTPTNIYRKIIKQALTHLPKHKGLLIDGGPKMPDEVYFVKKLLDKLGRKFIICIYIHVPWKETVKRNLKRKGYFGKKKRADDSVDALKIRYKVVQASIRRAMPVHKSLYPFVKINGLGTVTEVHKRVLEAVKRLSYELGVRSYE